MHNLKGFLALDSVAGWCYQAGAMPRFATQGHAEDLLLRAHYSFYVGNLRAIADSLYDEYKAQLMTRWSVNVFSVAKGAVIGYPLYIQWNMRPNEQERLLRDAAIAARWMENL